MNDNATANDHTAEGAIPRDLPVGSFGGVLPVMWGSMTEDGV